MDSVSSGVDEGWYVLPVKSSPLRIAGTEQRLWVCIELVIVLGSSLGHENSEYLVEGLCPEPVAVPVGALTASER